MARSRTTSVLRVNLDDCPVVVKHYRVLGLRGLWRRLGSRPFSRNTHAAHEARALRALNAVDLAPRVLFSAERRRLGLPWIGMLVVEFLKDHVTLAAWRDGFFGAAPGPGDDAPAAVAMDMALLVGGAVRRMHDAGIEHRDLEARNILVNAVACDVRFIDCRKARVGARLSGRARRRDIAELSRCFEGAGGSECREAFRGAALGQ